MTSTGAFHIGTSGWHYKHWREVFYPAGLAMKKWLPFYAERFRTTEINNSFYHLPLATTFDLWRESVPDGFLFAVKGSRYITHLKKLCGTDDAVKTLLDRVKRLRAKTGPVLFQLPPNFKPDPPRLREFLVSLPGGFRYVFEFRHHDWFTDDVYAVLRDCAAAFCVYDRGDYTTPLEVTADFVYVRFHGGTAAGGDYDDAALRRWAGRFAGWSRSGKDVFAYFNNDWGGFAVKNARAVLDLLGEP